MLYLNQFNTKETMLTAFLMTLKWIISFFALFFSVSLFVARPKGISKPIRKDVRNA